MSLKDDLTKKEPSMKLVLDGEATLTVDEDTSADEFKKFNALGKDVVDQYDVVTMPETIISKQEVNRIDYGGGYNQKTFAIEGNSVNGASVFNLTALSVTTNQIKILGVQLLQTVAFSPATINSWIARWKLNGGAVSIDLMDNTSDVLNYVGMERDIFFDSNANSDLTIGDNYIEIELWNAGDTAEKADNTDGKIVGVIHYIEMPDMEIPTS